ncbi:MAG TPA: ABC transporter ATP-binding protein [Caldimonas sp.]|jgi:iron complex transport system ATP-binding protein|nr:ABC transporter ATP-binding protein [Caldimonas sp.]HEX2540475.1 ABC transporter ATP-binding protein [Caldimonas sp.]
MKAGRIEVAGLALNAGGLAWTRRLFARLDFEVRAGERWVVIGPNGAGKSSLLAALSGTFPAAAGAIRLDGRPLAEWSMAALAAERAWSPQFWFDPFPSTVLETAALAHRRDLRWRFGFATVADEEVHRVLDRVSLAPLAHVDVRILSGGERQRVALATALLQGAPILLLDEPASHLDPAHQRLLLRVLREHADDGGAVVASLHDLNLAWDLASHAVLIDGLGAAVAGTRSQVFDPHRLGEVFGVRIDAVEVGGATRFLTADVPAAGAPVRSAP